MRIAVALLFLGFGGRFFGGHPLQSGYGPHFVWEGTTDCPTTVAIRARTVEITDGRATGSYRARYRLSTPLADSAQEVRLRTSHTSAAVRIRAHPSKKNDYRAEIVIDPGARTVASSVLVYWYKYPHSWFDAPLWWWNEQDFVRWTGSADGTFVLRCGQRVCEPFDEAGRALSGGRFDFGLELPRAGSPVTVTAVTSKGSANVIEQPSKENGHHVRVLIKPAESGRYGVILAWERSTPELL